MVTASEQAFIAQLPMPPATQMEADGTGSAPADNGYDWITQMQACGWTAVAAWGQDGWDLGEWPYNVTVVYWFRICGAHAELGDGERWAVANRIEGDLEVRVFTTFQERCEHIDRIAYDHWVNHGGGPDVTGGLRDEHRGPFGTARQGWVAPRHVLPKFGIPYGEHGVIEGSTAAVRCPVCFTVCTENEVPPALRAKVLAEEGYDPSKLASAAYAAHFQTEAEAGR